MEWLNYHHLLYFYWVAKEGGLTPAARKLRLAHPTISGQIHALEDALAEKLFVKEGRRLVLTEMGRVVYRYAEEIFTLGTELVDTVKGRPTGQPVRLAVGVADAVPKLVARSLLEPARHLPQEVRLICRENKPDRLLAELSLHALDVVLSDGPVPPGSNVRAFHHLLGECSVSFFGVPRLAELHRKGFPRSLDGAPMLLPTDNTNLRRSLEHWFGALGIRPRVVGEFEDTALLNVFGQDGAGLCPAPSAIEREMVREHGMRRVGRVPEVRERFFAISVERRLRHPGVVAIQDAARSRLFNEPA